MQVLLIGDITGAADLVLSGVNRGNNAAENVLYSGTIGATIEAALQGIPAIALSQFYGPDNANLDDPFEAAAAHGAETVRRLLKDAIWDEAAYRLFYNVNFPPVPAADVKGTKAVRQGRREGTNFGAEPHHSPSGRRFLWIKGGDQRAPVGEDTDAGVNLAGYISVTPMVADLTAYKALETLEGKL